MFTLSSWTACHDTEQSDYYCHSKCDGNQTFLGETKIHNDSWSLVLD